MGNTLNVCNYGQLPVSSKAYALKPSTDPINFDADFGANSGTSGTSGSSSTSAVTEGINLNYLIGTKFYVFSETYYST